MSVDCKGAGSGGLPVQAQAAVAAAGNTAVAAGLQKP